MFCPSRLSRVMGKERLHPRWAHFRGSSDAGRLFVFTRLSSFPKVSPRWPHQLRETSFIALIVISQFTTHFPPSSCYCSFFAYCSRNYFHSRREDRQFSQKEDLPAADIDYRGKRLLSVSSRRLRQQEGPKANGGSNRKRDYQTQEDTHWGG